MRAYQEVGRNIPQEPQPNYETVTDSGLRRFLENTEAVIQRYQEWPIRLADVPHRFSHVVGLERYYMNGLLQTIRKKEVIDVIVEKLGKRSSYLLDQNGARAFLVLCYIIAHKAMPVGRQLSLENAVAETKKALGSCPLRELLHDPKPNQFQKQRTRSGPRLPVLSNSIPVAQGKKNGDDGAGPTDWEEAVIQTIEDQQNPPLGKIPFFELQQLETASQLTREILGEIYKKIPSGWVDEVSFQKLMSLGVQIHPDHIKMVMFISAVFARDKKELRDFDPQLESLNYRQLGFGLKRCIDIFERNHHIEDLAALFDQAQQVVAQKQKVLERV